MSIYRMQKMKPRDGHTLVVLGAARISGCANQKDVSLEDQEEHMQEVVGEIYEGDSVNYQIIATKGKGELLTRPELAEIEKLLRSRKIDIFIKEDLGRFIRGIEASRMYGIAVDHGTRCIAINDGLDTWEEGWEEDVIAASRDHVSHNIQTSKRLKKKLMLRFKRKGAATPCPIAAYIKPERAETFYDWFVNESDRPKVMDGATQLRAHLNCSATADYFNTVKFPVGPFCKNQKWDGAMVRRFFSNPILKGKPERGNMHSVKHHETGKRRSVKNPDGPVSIHIPHLEIIPEEEFDELNALLLARNSSRGRKPYANGLDPLKGVSRKRTRFPGQHARCWYCGRNLVWGGNGIKNNLQCTGSRQYQCWNSIGFPGDRLTNLAVEAVWELLDEVVDLDSELFQIASNLSSQPSTNFESAMRGLKSQEDKLAKEEKNLLEIMMKFGASDTVEKGLKSLSEKKRDIQIEKSRIRSQQVSKDDIPESTTELRSLVKSKFLDLASDSYEFGHLFPKIVPEVFVYCVRLCSGGPLLPRAKIKIDLTGSFGGLVADDLREILITEITVDLFDRPSFELHRNDIVELHREGNSKKVIGSKVGDLSLRMINKALDLQEVVKSQELSDPYILQLEPPQDLPKQRRHLHPRFEFEMLDGYERKNL